MKGYGVTNKGKVRKDNQDSYMLEMLTDKDGAIFVVCDGMGGAKAGGVASSMAANIFMAHVESCLQEAEDGRPLAEIAREAAVEANRVVYARSQSDSDCRGMGTTLVGAIVMGEQVVVANVGDSRAYLLSGETISRITRDHSFVEELVSSGEITPEEARTHPRKNLITRALGVEPQVLCDIFTPELHSGDMLLFCSDGLSNLVTPEEILDARHQTRKLNTLCRQLMKLALERGAPDNVTVAVLER